MGKPGFHKMIIFFKFLLCLLLMYLIVFSGCSSPLEEKKDVFNLRLYPSSVEVEEGKETTVSVWVDEAIGLIATRFTISFDPTIVEIVNIQTSGTDFIFTEAGVNVVEIENDYNNESGKIVIGIGAQKEGFTGVDGSGSLVSILFKAKSIGESDLSFVDTQSDDIVTTAYSDKAEAGWIEFPVQTFDAVITVKEKAEEPPEELP